MRSVWLIALVVVGCGRYRFERVGGGDDDGDGDVPLAEFTTARTVSEVAGPGVDDDPTATGDALELYFASDRLGAAGAYADIFVAQRASRSDSWGPPQAVVELNTADEDQAPGVSADGLTIYISSRRPSPLGGSSSNFWVSTRASRTDLWSTPGFVAELSTTNDEFEPQPDPSHLRLVFYRQLGTNRELFESTRASTSDPWGTPVAIASVNTTFAERSPCLANNGHEIWFGSDRASSVADIADLFSAVRPTTSDPFALAQPLAALNSGSDDDDPWLSPDGHVLLFTSNRSGNYEIYEAQR